MKEEFRFFMKHMREAGYWLSLMIREGYAAALGIMLLAAVIMIIGFISHDLLAMIFGQ